MDFLGRFSNNCQNINFMKIRAVGSPVVSCGWADVTKLMTSFRDLVIAPKNVTTF